MSAFTLALTIVTLLHLVVGEMKPKSLGDRPPRVSRDPVGAPEPGLLLGHPPLLVP